MENTAKTGFFSSDAWKKVKNLFGGYDMTWKRVVIFAVITAVITAVLNIIPALKDTSFTDIAVNPECWILFAVFIIVNCKTWKEAALKCFVFFLISQPLIYLIEVPFVNLGWKLFVLYYPRWAKITLLTLPGAAIAFFVKRKDWLSVAILSVATGFLSYMSAAYFKTAAARFPRHLLSAVFCLALIVFFIITLLDNKIKRTVAFIVAALVFAGTFMINGADRSTTLQLGSGEWDCSVDDESVVTVEIDENNEAKIRPVHDGYSYIYFTDENGVAHEYYATVSGGSIWLDDMTEASNESEYLTGGEEIE